MAKTWTSNTIWQNLTPTQKAAAMALLEADIRDGKISVSDAKNALGAMINRSEKSGEDLGVHVSRPIYQPTIEPAQFNRLQRIIGSPEHIELTQAAERRISGQEPDWVKGATHFLAPEKTMLALEAREPKKYKNWGPNGANWTGYDPATGSYRGVIMRDGSHAFLAPDDPPSPNATAAAIRNETPVGGAPTPIQTAGAPPSSSPPDAAPETPGSDAIVAALKNAGTAFGAGQAQFKFQPIQDRFAAQPTRVALAGAAPVATLLKRQ